MARYIEEIITHHNGVIAGYEGEKGSEDTEKEMKKEEK